MKHLKTYETFDGLKNSINKTLDKIKKNKIFNFSSETHGDDDLAMQIIMWLDTVDVKYDNKIIKKISSSHFVTFGKFFSKSKDFYKIDILKHMDFKTNNRTEYTLTLSKVKTKTDDVTYGGLGSGINLYGRKNRTNLSPNIGEMNTRDKNKALKNINNTDAVIVTTDVQVLKCNQKKLKSIYDKMEQIYTTSTKTNAGDARGGVNL